MTLVPERAALKRTDGPAKVGHVPLEDMANYAPNQAAQHFGVSRGVIYHWILRNFLPATKFARQSGLLHSR